MKVIIDTENVTYLLKQSNYFTLQEIQVITDVIGQCIENGDLTAKIERLEKEVKYWKDRAFYNDELSFNVSKMKAIALMLLDTYNEGSTDDEAD